MSSSGQQPKNWSEPYIRHEGQPLRPATARVVITEYCARSNPGEINNKTVLIDREREVLQLIAEATLIAICGHVSRQQNRAEPPLSY
jgi:hypothetical protein